MDGMERKVFVEHTGTTAGRANGWNGMEEGSRKI